MARARAQAAVADGNYLRDGQTPWDEPDAGHRDDDRADLEPADREVPNLEPTDRQIADREAADLEPTDPEIADREAADLEPTDQEWAGKSDARERAADEPTDEPADDEPTEGSADQLRDGEPTEGPADQLGDGEPTGELADRGPGDDDEGWPGVAPAAGWFLHPPEEGGGADPAAAGAPAVSLPRREPDTAWPGSPGSGSRPAGAWSVPRAEVPAEPVVGATRALWGRAGGPGFRPGRPGPGTRRAAPEPSPWQKSQGLWRDSGIAWDEREAHPAAPASAPRRELRPSPLPPRSSMPVPDPAPQPRPSPLPPRSSMPVPDPAPQPRPSPLPPRSSLAVPDPAPQRWAGRNAGPGSLPTELINGAGQGQMRVPLGAPVFAEAERESREDRGTLRVDEEPDLPWDVSLGWGRASGSEQQAAPGGSRRGANDTLLLEEEPPETWRPDPGRNRGTRRTARIAVPVIVLVAVAALALALLTGHGPRFGQLAASQPRDQGPALPQSLAAAAFGTYPGQQQRGVFQTINRVVASGNTIVTMGSQTSDGVVRQQFFVSTNAGATWRLAPEKSPGGGQAPLGHPASLLAGGPGGWAAIGPRALWTSQDGQSWTLAATHGITPQLPGDSVWVITRTAQGFLAAGSGSAGPGAAQAVLWTSPDGVTWHRMTAAQLGLAAAGERVLNISYATWLGDDTLISGEVAGNGTTYSGVWLSTNGGSAWTRVTIPAGHGAGTSVTGVASDSAGLLAVRPGRTASGTADGVAYFSPNGRAWQYSGTIDEAGGWTPGVVKGSVYGFVVAGTSAAGQLVAYTSTGTGASWQPTGPLGNAADESVVGATVAPAGTIIAVGYTTRSKIGQQALLLEANTAGAVRPVSLAGLPGGVIPELTVNGLAVAGGQQVAVGSADGYPAVWWKASGSSWALVTSLSSVPAGTGLTALTGVTHGSAGWLAVGAPGPYVATSADGTAWQFATGPGSITHDLAGVSAVATAAGPAGYIIVGKLVAPGGSCVADVWWSPNLTTWVRAHDVNDATGSSQVLAVAASAHGFVSAGSHDGRPAVWTTTNGRAWTTIVLPMPAGATGAVLQQIAISGDRVVALGQETTAAGTLPFAELSVDGGTSWQQVPFRSPGPDTAFTAITAGPGGFAAAGQFGEPGQRDVAVWTSAEGTVWSPSQVSGLTGAQAGGSYLVTALAPAGSGVTGVGSVATQQSLQTFTVTLPAG